jgi:hypothetical protein
MITKYTPVPTALGRLIDVSHLKRTDWLCDNTVNKPKQTN